MEVRAAPSIASWIMRGPEMAVAVAALAALDRELEPGLVLLVSEDCHEKAAITPASISNTTSVTLAMAMTMRRRFGSRQPLPFPWLSIGGTGGNPNCVSSGPVGTGAGTVGASAAAISSGAREPVAARLTDESSSTSASVSGCLRPHRKRAGTMAIRQSTIVVKKTAL